MFDEVFLEFDMDCLFRNKLLKFVSVPTINFTGNEKSEKQFIPMR